MTPRELARIAEKKLELDWQHTASLMSVIHNILSKSPKKPDDFNPFSKKNRAKKTSMTFREMREAFEGSNDGG